MTGHAGMRALLAGALVVFVLAGCDRQATRFGDGMRALVARDYHAAYERLAPMASSGYAPAQFRIGLMHAFGVGVPKNAEQAAYWYRKAAHQGEVAALYYLAMMYAKGDGIRRDPGQALHWMGQLARRNYAPAQFRLGELYGDGSAGPADRDESLRWLRKAADQGYPPAMRALATVEE